VIDPKRSARDTSLAVEHWLSAATPQWKSLIGWVVTSWQSTSNARLPLLSCCADLPSLVLLPFVSERFPGVFAGGERVGFRV